MPASNSEARKRHNESTLELDCGCVIEGQYLPLQGGDRLVTCHHDHKYVVRGRVEKFIHLTAERQDA